MTKKSFKNQKIWITSGRGMLGIALTNLFKKKKIKFISSNKDILDLRKKTSVIKWLKKKKPDIIILNAALVGGIYANNKYPVNFLKDNLEISLNVLEAAAKLKIKKLIYIGSSCIYPKFSKQPIKEQYLLTGSLEETNQWYAIAKIAGIKLCQAYRKQKNLNFISLMPCNMYGPADNYHPKNSHVLAALIRKFVLAKKNKDTEVEIWGSGRPLREFMHVNDFAESIIIALKKYNGFEPLNVGSGEEVSIQKLSLIIAKLTGFKGKIYYNKKYPDGVARKVLNSKKIKNLGWRPKIKLKNGIKMTIKNFINENINNTSHK